MDAIPILMFIMAAIFTGMAVGFGTEEFTKSSIPVATVTAVGAKSFYLKQSRVHIEYGHDASEYDIVCHSLTKPTINDQDSWMGLSFEAEGSGLYRMTGKATEPFEHEVIVGNEVRLHLHALEEKHFQSSDLLLAVGTEYVIYPHGTCEKTFMSPIEGMEWDLDSRALRGTPTRSGTFHVGAATIQITEALAATEGEDPVAIRVHESANQTFELPIGVRVDERLSIPGPFSIVNPDETEEMALPEGLRLSTSGRLTGRPLYKTDRIITIRSENTYSHLRIRVCTRLTIDNGFVPVGHGMMINVRGYQDGTLIADTLPDGLKVSNGILFGTIDKKIHKGSYRLRAYGLDGELAVGDVVLESTDKNNDYLILFIVSTIAAVAFLIAGFVTSFMKKTNKY